MSSAKNGVNGASILANSRSKDLKRPRASFLFLERRNHQLERSSITNFSIALAAVVGSYLSKLSETSPTKPLNLDNIHLSSRFVTFELCVKILASSPYSS